MSLRVLVAPLLVLLLLALTPAAASARAFQKRFGANDTGDVTIAANTLMTCPSPCAKAGAAASQTTSDATLNNNNYSMVTVDTDGDASTLVSSSATLDLPDDATVLYAGLYWGAKTDAGTGGQAADAGARGAVRLKGPSGGYQAVTASVVDVQNDSAYQGFADVTAMVSARGRGLYTLGGAQVATGADRYGGWSLVVAYHDPAAPSRNLTIFDGFERIIAPATPSANISVSGFQTPPAPSPVTTRLGAVSYEGDLGSTGDQMQLNSVAISNALNPASNVFNSTVSDGATQVLSGRDPAQRNHFGFDADILPAPAGSLANGATSATISLQTNPTNGETFYPGVLTFATDLFAPKVRPVTTVTDLDGGLVEPGDVLEYVTEGENVGTDRATTLDLTSDVPAGFEFLPGTLEIIEGAGLGAQTPEAGDDRATWDAAGRQVTWRLGTGATPTSGGELAVGGRFAVRFRVRVAAPPNGASVGVAAEASYTGAGTGYTFDTDGRGGAVTISGPNLELAVAHTGTLVRGRTTSSTLTARNTGAADTLGVVQVVDDLPAGADLDGSPSGTGWSCTTVARRVTCERSDALAPGAAYPAITVPLRIRQDALSPLVHAAAVSGGSDGVHADDTGSDTAPVTSQAALSLALPAPGSPVAPGETVTLQATVANAGPSDATAAVLALAVPADLEIVSATHGGSACTPSACALGTVAAGTGTEVAVVVRAARAAHGRTLALSATASTATPDTTSGDDARTATIVVADERRVSVAQSVTPGPLVAGEAVHVAFSIRNDGPADAQDVVLTETLPEALREIRLAAGAPCSVTGHVLRCEVGALADGASAAFGLDAVVAPDAGGGSLTFRAELDPVAGDPVRADDVATAVRAVDARADVSLALVSAPDSIAAGADATWSMRVLDAGPSDASGVTVRLPLPAGVSFVRASGASCAPAGGALVCALGGVGSGGARDLDVTLAAARDLAAGSIALEPVASADQPDPDLGDLGAVVRTDVVRAVDLGVTQAHGPAELVAGAPASFTSTVRNAGPSDATGVVLTLTLPAELRGAAVALRGAPGECAIAAGAVRCTIARLAAGERATLELAGTVAPGAAGAVLVPAARVRADQPDLAPSDDASSDRVHAVARNDLSVGIRAPESTIVTGAQATLAITVHNDGPSDAAGVVLTQLLPAEAEVVSLDPRCTLSGRTLTCAVGEVGVGESVPLDVRVRARAPFDGRRLGTGASVRGAGADPRPANDAVAPAAPASGPACRSVRRFTIRLRVPRTARPGTVRVTVDGTPVKVRRGKRLTATLDLRGRDGRAVVVRIRAVTAAGRRLSGTRTYHPCAERRPGRGRPRI